MSRIKEHEIVSGVSYKDAKRKAKLIYDTKVAPFLKEYQDLKEDIELTDVQQAFSKCQNPF